MPRLRAWAHLMRAGDWGVLAACALAVAASFQVFWRGGVAEEAVVRASGQVVAKLRLDRAAMIDVPGPLGTTRIETQPGRVRVAADPGPRQYCVRQGWLTQPNSIAICAPNEVSVTLIARNRPYDSLAY